MDERDSSSLTFSDELVLLLILQIINLDFFHRHGREDSPWTSASNWRLLLAILAPLLDVVLVSPEGFSFSKITFPPFIPFFAYLDVEGRARLISM